MASLVEKESQWLIGAKKAINDLNDEQLAAEIERLRIAAAQVTEAHATIMNSYNMASNAVTLAQRALDGLKVEKEQATKHAIDSERDYKEMQELLLSSIILQENRKATKGWTT